MAAEEVEFFMDAKVASEKNKSRLLAYGLLMKSTVSFIIDIPFHIMGVVVLLSVYRGIAMVKDMRHEDLKLVDLAYRAICLHHFLNFLLDIPFLLLGLVVTFTWRSKTFWTEIRAERINVGDRRLRALYHFCWLVPDVVTLVLYIPCFLVLWRIPTFLHILSSKRSFLAKMFVSWTCIICDLLSLAMFVFVCLGLFQVKPFFRRAHSLVELFPNQLSAEAVPELLDESPDGESSDSEGPGDEGGPGENEGDDSIFHDDFVKAMKHMRNLDGPASPISLSLFFKLLQDSSYKTLLGLHHVLFMPLKLIGYAFMPIFWWLQVRMNGMEKLDDDVSSAKC